MADSAPTSPKAPAAEKSPLAKACCGWSDLTVVAILLRICAAMLLLLSGTDKFKSATNPAVYSLDNYYGSTDQLADKNWVPKMMKIVGPVFVNSGLDNADKIGKQNATAVAWSFHYFAVALPWLMIVSGLMILLGLCSRIGHFVGGIVWLSLIIGQLLLPDIEGVVRLLVIFLVGIAAMAVQSHSRFRITRF